MDPDEAMKLLKGGPDGVAEWNRRREAEEAIPDLSGLNFSGAYLSGVNLGGADLGGGNFSGASLYGANLSNADLISANLFRAELSDADLRRVDLMGANLGGANLSRASLTGADLTDAFLGDANVTDATLKDADFKSTTCYDTVFGGSIDLRLARKLESVNFVGPCTVDNRVLIASKGRIPESFLEGCGFQQWEILSAKMYDPALSPLEIADLQAEIFRLRTEGPLYIGGVFISYAHADTKLVDKLYDRLKEEKITVWLDKHDLVAGPLQRQVVRSIRMMDVVVLMLSEASVHSDWVDDEVRAARVKEKEENRDVLCPIALDDTWKKKLGTGRSLDDMEEADADWMHLAKKNVLDFSEWESEETFEAQFKKLLKGMKIYYTPEQRDEGTQASGGRMKDEG